eukprot:NODE_492_length_1424_cov_218.110545_g372_i0.p1 GENE.NODE_492_length_1424_cov_218.110545_g372_i0~~NODE_492_length_1424_cov_218.110545_g372_i0.p1  ORF type:complete len:368 (-),score=39.83 NODE_492_length_1424_cov_218.110545_g372_i0:249-1352(-)
MKQAENTARLLKKVPLPDEIQQVCDNAVVFDCGAFNLRAGFSGEDAPRFILPSTTELVDGRVTDWDSMQNTWQRLYNDCLRIPADDPSAPVLLSEQSLTPGSDRERAAQILFETLRVPAVYFSPAPVLALYASGRTTGLVVDAGYHTVHAVPIFEGFSLFHAITRLELGGSHLTEFLGSELAGRGICFPKAHQRDIIGFLKEKYCEVAPDYQALTGEPPGDDSVTHRLPDGSEVTLGRERFRCGEVLFEPSLIGRPQRQTLGLHTAVIQAVGKVDTPDITPQFYSNMVLAGGTSMLRGLPERLTAEVKRLLQANDASDSVRLLTPTERKTSAWVGGSILASLPTFQDCWVSQADWKEDGHLIHRDCF